MPTVTLWSEGFETDGNGTRYTLSNAEFHTATSSINDDFFGRTNGTTLAGVAFTSSVAYSGASGSFYFAANDTDESAVTTHSRTITFSTINISGQTNLQFSGLFAEDEFTNGSEDWDADTVVYVEVSIDGGAFQKILQFAATGSNTAPRLDTDFDGVGDSTVLSDAFQTFTAGISGTGADLDVRIVMENLNLNDEDIAFDNFLVTAAATPATLSIVFVDAATIADDDAVEGDEPARFILSTDIVPSAKTIITIVNPSSEIDLGSGFGSNHDVDLQSGPVTVTATALDDSIIEGDESVTLSFLFAGTGDPNFTINPINDTLDIRLIDNDPNNPTEGIAEVYNETFETDGAGTRYILS